MFWNITFLKEKENIKGAMIDEAFEMQKNITVHNYARVTSVVLLALGLISAIAKLSLATSIGVASVGLAVGLVSLHLTQIIKTQNSIISRVFKEYPKYEANAQLKQNFWYKFDFEYKKNEKVFKF